MHLCFSFFNYITHIIITVIAFLLLFFFIIQRNPCSKNSRGNGYNFSMCSIYFQVGIHLLTLENVFHDICLMSNPFKKEEDDTNQVRFEFDLKMFADQFCKIKHIYLIIYLIKRNSKIYYFRRYKLLYKSYKNLTNQIFM